MISKRTKSALQVAKGRGVKLGNPNLNHEDRLKGNKVSCETRSKSSKEFAQSMYGVILPLKKDGKTLQGIANHLNEEGYLTSRKGEWKSMSVKRVIDAVESM